MAQAPQEWTVLSMLEWATAYFEQRQVPSPRMSIEWLLADVLEIKRLDLYMKFDRPLSGDELDILRPLVKRRAQHEPLQYITGYTDFMNVRLRVTPDVLIPRMETEQLVEIILDRHSNDQALTVVDLGTGSGCIPVSLKKERPNWEIHGLDISEEALSIAQENAELNDVIVTWHQHDILHLDPAKFPESIDILISNPPYVLEEERSNLEPQVVEYEPDLALYCKTPEQYYQPIAAFANEHLQIGGMVYFELHDQHGDKIQNYFPNNSWNFKLERDYDSNLRFLISERIS